MRRNTEYHNFTFTVGSNIRLWAVASPCLANGVSRAVVTTVTGQLASAGLEAVLEGGSVGTGARERAGQVLAKTLASASGPVQTFVHVVAVDEGISSEAGLASARESSGRVAAHGVGSAFSRGAQRGVTLIDVNAS